MYELPLKQYAAVGRKPDVYRIWEQYKKLERQFNIGYISMISALLQLDDLDEAEKIYKEWESKNAFFDIRLLNLMINAYPEKGAIKKAEVFVEKIVKKEKETNAITWENLAAGYLQDGQMFKAVETIKKAISVSCPGWIPKIDTLTRCLEYLKVCAFQKAARELLKMINEQSCSEKGTSWAHLATAYLLSGETTKAVEMLKNAILANKSEMPLRYDTLAAFLKHLKAHGEEGTAKELLEMINLHCRFSRLTYNRLVSYVIDEKLETEPLHWMDDDDQNFG